jgi:hypothetical protein
MIITTINPPKPVANLSLITARPLFPRVSKRVTVICLAVQFAATGKTWKYAAFVAAA